ncbi:MAG: CRISPR-associated endonuclease Cas2 [Lentisphaerae bacterium]|jgi:CRISPR-associated protein Cas2|nr:CRISPR-associated endonuclease Cas2 [Lentisphaerota bacterium]
MMVLITYDVSTINRQGQSRLRRVAKACLDYGQRVQNSVFECDITPAQWVELKHRLLKIVDLNEDSLRFYFLGSNWQRKVDHFGIKESLDLKNDPLVL